MLAEYLSVSPALVTSLLRRYFYRLEHPVARRVRRHDLFRVVESVTTEQLRTQTTMALVDRAAAYNAANPGERLDR